MTEIDKSKAAWKNGEVPIIIGATAHRNIRAEAEPRVIRQVGEALDAIIELCPHSPIVMLTGLASGGDQLCARVALERGINIMIALPEKEEDYLNEVDFARGSLEEFKRIKALPQVIGEFVAPDTEKLPHSDTDKDYNFRQQAIYVATNCHVLLALWDGTDAPDKRSECGTNAAVGFALKHNYYQPNGMEFYPSADGAVIKIFSPRDNRAYGENADESIKYLVPPRDILGSANRYYIATESMPKSLTDILVRTDRYNGDYLDGIKKLKKEEEREDWQYLMTAKEYECGSDKSRRIHDCQVVSSALSGKNKTKNIRMLMTLAIFGMGLILAFMVYDQLTFWWSVTVCLSMLAALVAVYVITYFADKSGHGRRSASGVRFGVHSRFIEYRALSEALRIQYYLTLYGMDVNVCRYMTWAHKSLMPWVRKAVLALTVGENAPIWADAQMSEYYVSLVLDEQTRIIKSNGNDAQSVFENIMFTKWVGYDKYFADYNKNGQIGYHLKSMSDKSKNIKRRDTIKTVALVVTLLTYIGLFLCELIPYVDMEYRLVWIIDIRVLFKGALSVFAALTFLISYYYGKQSLDQIKADSVNMIGLYRIAIDRADDIYRTFASASDCRAAFRSLILGLAAEQLVENATWVAYNRDDNIEMPI